MHPLRTPGHHAGRHRCGRRRPALRLPHPGAGRRRASSRPSPTTAAPATPWPSNSATSALHLACLALGSARAIVLWTTPITFVASANCALYCGASGGLRRHRPAHLQPERRGPGAEARPGGEGRTLPKVVIPVHFAGQSCDMDRHCARWRALWLQGPGRRLARHRRAATKGTRSAPAAFPTSPCSASIRSRSSPPAKAAWR